jgi:voltage-gated potassium channel
MEDPRTLRRWERGEQSAEQLAQRLDRPMGALGLLFVLVLTGQLLFATGTYSHYGDALHGAALAAITGEPLAADGAVARWTEVALAVYSVAVFAALAGSLGAFFLRRAPETPTTDVTRTFQREE